MAVTGNLARFTSVLHDLGINLIAGLIQNLPTVAAAATLTAAGLGEVISKMPADVEARKRVMDLVFAPVCALCLLAGALTYVPALTAVAWCAYSGTAGLAVYLQRTSLKATPVGLAHLVTALVVAPSCLAVAVPAWRISPLLAIACLALGLGHIIGPREARQEPLSSVGHLYQSRGAAFAAPGLIIGLTLDLSLGVALAVLGTTAAVAGTALRRGNERVAFLAMAAMGACLTLPLGAWANELGVSLPVALAVPLTISLSAVARAHLGPGSNVAIAIIFAVVLAVVAPCYLQAGQTFGAVGFSAASVLLVWTLWMQRSGGGGHGGWSRVRDAIVAANRAVHSFYGCSRSIPGDRGAPQASPPCYLTSG